MSDDINPEWAETIRREAAALHADEEHLHNTRMHGDILTAWREHSSRMWERLIAADLAEPLAMVLQARMWVRAAGLERAGLPMTDARELAEREHLMMEAEAVPDDITKDPDWEAATDEITGDIASIAAWFRRRSS